MYRSRLLLLVLLICIWSQPPTAHADWVDDFSSFDSSRYTTMGMAPGCAEYDPAMGAFRLISPVRPYEELAGRLVYEQQYSMHSFEASFRFRVEAAGVWPYGMDGIVFAWSPDRYEPLAGAQYLDWLIGTGYAVELDLYNNEPAYGDCCWDFHVALAKDGVEGQLAIGPIPMLSTHSWHDLRIVNTAGDIQVYLDGALVLSHVIADYAPERSYFRISGTSFHYFGNVWVDDIVVRHQDAGPFPVTFGTSWDGISLQDILDAEYGAGAINVQTDFEGAQAGDAVIPYWIDDAVDGWLIREVADFAPSNVLGWYAEEITGPPAIDGIDDGVIFDGSGSEGETAFVGLTGPTRFGLYLNPNGSGDAPNAPEPEIFFTNRAYNDEGPDGSGAIHAPEGGDPQALIFNITHLRGGVPTYVIAWEDIDSGSELRDTYAPGYTDNDYNDLVVEIQASSPVKTDASSWGELKSRFGQ